MDFETNRELNREVRIHSLSPSSADIARQLPLNGRLCKRLKALDRHEYWLVRLAQPLPSPLRKKTAPRIDYLVLWPEEEDLFAIKKNHVFKTGVDIVLENDLLNDEYIVFSKCETIGVGSAVLTELSGTGEQALESSATVSGAAMTVQTVI